jgi:hypothetical protein
LDVLRTSIPRTVPSLRLCGSAGSPGPVSPARPAPGKAPEGTAGSGGVRGVSPRDTGGTDIGQAVFDLAYSCGIVAAYRSATVKWALEQGK